ncbi:unnamed protein product [Rotaria sordida]|uniref:Uncharacterized protein n=3 Tax=Rotaria sordida TaxID=392033 RepID=A0A814UK25_9BILA|nr:unnamed protein product [Rotaria sordida]
MTSSTHSAQRKAQTEQESLENFKKLDIGYRFCWKFCPKFDDEETCVCNQNKDIHKDQTGKKGDKWKMSKNTKEQFNNEYFGTLFKNASYVRLDIDTKLTKVEKLLLEFWDIPKPNLIMSIIGGAKYFTLKDELESIFINGVMDVAVKSNVWMITTGYNVGIVQLLGQAISKVKLKDPNQQLIVIGICKWGSIKNIKTLTGIDEEKYQKNKRRFKESDDEEAADKLKSGECNLEKNHSHYLMVDDGRYRYFNTENFRTRLCQHMVNVDTKNDVHTPVVTIVVEGGLDTIANIYNDLKNDIPIVIIKGSGRVADFFGRWLLDAKIVENDSEQGKIAYEIDELNRTKTETKPVSKNEIRPKSKKRIDIHAELHLDSSIKQLRTLFSKYEKDLKEDLKNILSREDDSKKNRTNSSTGNNDSDEKLELALDQVMYCLQPAVRSQITVFNINSETDLSEKIFESICKSFQRSSKDSDEERIKRTPFLKLAMDWGCIHVAKEFVFQNSLDYITDPDEAFLTALKKNLPAFVCEFLKIGIEPADIFFPTKQFTEGDNRYAKFIEELYDDVLKTSIDETHLKYFIEDSVNNSDKKIGSVISLNAVLEELIGDYMHKLYFESEEDEEKDRIKWGLMQSSVKSKTDTNKDIENNKSSSNEQKKQKAKKYIMRDLFLWAILMNRIDMAKVFLSHMKYRICPALIATKILKQYHSKAHYGDLKKGYEKDATYFEQYAIDCLDKCDDNNADRACVLVIQQNELYGYVTCLQVASDAQDILFISEPACVQAMKNIWFDKLHPEQTSKTNQSAVFCSFISLGLLAPVVVEYREKEQMIKAHESPKSTLESYGVNYCDPYPLEYPRYFKSNLTLNEYIHRLKHFHLSLLVKFCYHVITYIFFLLLFSYVLLFNFSPPKPQSPSIHWTEILTIILVSCMLIQEFHYFFTQDNLTFSGKFKNSFRDFFKPMTTLAFILFYIGLILRFAYADSEEKFIAARVIMAYDIELWWLRSLSFIIVIPFLGPHLVAIGQMVKDLLFFMCIIAIVMISYGVASRSMVYYPIVNNFTTETGGPIDTSFDGRNVFRQIIYPVYYLLHGEFGNERLSLESNPNAGWSITTQILLAIHMLFVNILLINLLIAMFSKRFDKVYEDTKHIWHSQQYLFTREYFTRSPFLPPISLIYDIYYLFRMFVFFIRQNVFDLPTDRQATVFKMIAKNKSLLEEWREFEGASTYEYAHAQLKVPKDISTKSSNGSDSSSKEKKEDVTDNRNDLNDTMDNLKEVQEKVSELRSSIDGMKRRFTNYFTESDNDST